MKRFIVGSVMGLPSLGLFACGGEAIVVPGGSGGAGNTTNATAGTATGATTSGAGGASTERCDALEEEYAAAVRRATACDPFVDVPQCTELVFTTLRCPCEQVFVNPGNGQVLDELKTLTDEWDASPCGDDEPCPAIACEEPMQAICEPGGMNALGGTCQTQ